MGRGGARSGSGRPSGAKNKSTQAQGATLSEIAKGYAPEALEMLAEVMRYGSSDAARVAACLAILDRAYGRPKQADPEPQNDPLGELIQRIQEQGSKPTISIDCDEQSSDAPAPVAFDEVRTPHTGDQLCLKISEG